MEIRYRGQDGTGIFRAPDSEGPFPAVLALGGSDGGTPAYFADLLVPEGFACLALAYWATAGTQQWFTEIPLERVEQGLRWLIDRPEVATQDGRVALVGVSRGGELALLIASTFPELVGPVVAYTPGSVVWQGFDFTLPVGQTRSSWAYRGKPLPYVSFPPGAAPTQSSAGISWLPMMEPALDDAEAVSRAAIEIERCTGPVLLVSGGDDRVWPTARMCAMLTERMSRHGRRDAITHRNYPRAGHMLFPYSRPADTQVPDMLTDYGGSRDANAAAHVDAWPEVLRCLRGEHT